MGYESITKYTSPNSTPARDVPAVFGQPRTVKSITIHHWGSRGQRFMDVVNYLCTPWQNRPDRRQSSAHYVVEAGRSACIIDPDNAAWHSDNAAGNATSIGIECRPEATDADYATTAELIRDLRKVYGPVPLTPHRNWTSTACPGVWDLARLDRLARQDTITTASTKGADIMAKLDQDDYDAIALAVWRYTNEEVTKRQAYSHLVRPDFSSIPKLVWGYLNKGLTKDDAYLILRKILGKLDGKEVTK